MYRKCNNSFLFKHLVYKVLKFRNGFEIHSELKPKHIAVKKSTCTLWEGVRTSKIPLSKTWKNNFVEIIAKKNTGILMPDFNIKIVS